ncbi:hypothetical protein BG011_007719 [Mortierella polycephala]|uniref:Uncharacterized protein n=1 Tax=Mortierella polycephala TaxID=41804 RepID=A0A9P6PSS3_9FUNG|nr:hypothetical protein BG011_007719 [Mortierella polycephala]
MVGSNMVITFGLTAGGATNNIFIFDTTVNTWATSYTPSNLAETSTKPEDWPGYKPPPIPPPDSNSTDPNPPLPGNSTSNVGPIIGGIVGAVAIAVLIFVFVRRHHQQQMIRRRAQMVSYYGSDFSNQASMEQGDAYRHRGMAFDSEPVSFGQKMEQFWGGMGAAAFWRRDRRAENRSQSHRLRDQEEDEASKGISMPTDQEIFLDAVHRVRSRAGRLSPMFSPLQQPIAPTSPTSPRLSAAGFGSPLRGEREVGEIGELGELGEGVHVPCMEQQEVPHGRAYSDGFENAMLEMDIQMVGVPRGRLYVVNPSDENVDRNQGPEEPSTDQAYRGFDSQGPV